MKATRCALLLLLVVGLAAPDDAAAQQYYLGEWKPRRFEGVVGYVEHTPPANASVTVTVNAADTVAAVPPLIFGNNAVSWQQASHNRPQRVRHYKNANLSVLRFPGGNLSNEYFWDAPQRADLPKDIGGGVTGIPNYEWWRMTPSDYYALLDSVNAEGIISVNYSYARYGTSANPVQRAAEYAAAWVREANITRRLGIKYWEIGNENFGSWQTGYDVPGKGVITGEEYGRDFCVFVAAMKAVDPTIKVGAVTVEMPVGWNNDYNRWNQRMFPEIKDCADFLSVHTYFGPYQPARMTAPDIISAVNWVDEIAPYVRNQWTTITGKQPIPLAMTEFNMQTDYNCIVSENCYFSVGQLNSVVFALTFGKLIENRFALATAWDLENGWAGGRDHGMLANDDEPGVTPDTPHGSFFTYYYFTRFFGDVMVRSSVQGPAVKSFGSRFSSGEVGVVVVNPTATDQSVRLRIENVIPGKRYYLYAVQTNDPNSRKIYINGRTGTQEGSGPENYEAVPAYSGFVGNNGEILFDAPRYGTYYVLVESASNSVGVEAPDKNARQELVLYPNPASETVTLRYTAQVPGEVTIELYDVAGRLVRRLPAADNLPGSYSLSLDVSGLPASLYLCRVRYADGSFVTHRLAVIH